MRAEPGKEDQKSLLLLRITSSMSPASKLTANSKLTAAQIIDQMNAPQSSSSKHISRTTVKRTLHESGLLGQITARKPLLRRGNKQKTFVWTKKHNMGMASRPVEICTLV